MAASQIQGFTTANIVEVEANTRAMRVTLRPEDFGSLGIYAEGKTSAIMAAGLGAAAPIFSARWSHATNLCLIKRVTLSLGADTVAFAAGSALFNLFVARSWSAADTAGATAVAMTPTGNQNKLRTTGMGTTLFATGDILISTTGTITAGTRTLDSNPIGALALGVQATAGIPILAPWPMWDVRPGEYPLLLAQNEGIVLQATVPATGTWKFGIKMDWTEITAY
jgi:hypothetical protein